MSVITAQSEMSRLAGSSEGRPLRLLFLGEAVSLAHVARPAVLARWAQDAGHKVHFACGHALAHIVRGEGLEPTRLTTIAGDDFFRRISQIQFMYTAEELEEYVRAELDILSAVQPDLVVSDFRLSAAISCTLTGTPHLSLANAYWSPAYPCRFLPPRGGPFRFMPLWLRKALVSTLRPIAFRWLWGRSVNQARLHFGLAKLPDFRLHYCAGDWCAYMDLPDFVPVGPLPQGHFLLGPVPWQPRRSEADLGTLGTTRPLIYVSLKSPADSELLNQVLRTLLDADCDMVLSHVTPAQAIGLPRALPGLQRRWLAREYLAPGNVLDQATATICHGGSGTVYQSLQAGVPVLCLPTNGDQGLVADHVAIQGAGIRLEPERATPRRLRTAMQSLLTQASWTANARQLAEALRRYDTRQNWLEFLAGLCSPSGARIGRDQPRPGLKTVPGQTLRNIRIDETARAGSRHYRPG